jgi:hypothetical protein
MSKSRLRLWQECSAQCEPATAGRLPVLQCSEWIRVLVGKPLALAQQGDGHWRYLVHGVPSDDLVSMRDTRGISMAARGLRSDFLHLNVCLDALRRRVAGSPGDCPETFLRSFHLLWSVNLPIEPEAWLVTDEGLTVVQWGLVSGRQLFEWTPSHLQHMESVCLGRLGREPMAETGCSLDIHPNPDRRLSVALGSRIDQRGSVVRSGFQSSPSHRAPQASHWAREPLVWSMILLSVALGAAGGYALAMHRAEGGRQPVAGASARHGSETPRQPVDAEDEMASEPEVEGRKN